MERLFQRQSTQINSIWLVISFYIYKNWVKVRVLWQLPLVEIPKRYSWWQRLHIACKRWPSCASFQLQPYQPIQWQWLQPYRSSWYALPRLWPFQSSVFVYLRQSVEHGSFQHRPVILPLPEVHALCAQLLAIQFQFACDVRQYQFESLHFGFSVGFLLLAARRLIAIRLSVCWNKIIFFSFYWSFKNQVSS